MTAGRRVNTKSIHWCTPPKFVEPITEFMGHIDLDPCSNKESIVKAATELTDSGLDYDWNQHATIFVNPPYGKGIYSWLKKCSEVNSEVIALIPVATNTRHWKDFIFNSEVICFISDTRLKFMIDGTTDNKGASMACCLVYWGNRAEDFTAKFSEYGRCCVSC